MTFECLERVGVKLSDIPAHLEQKCVSEFESSIDKLLVLVILGHDLGVPRIGCQVDCECDKFLSNDRLRTVNDQLVDDWDALRVSERGLELVLLGHVVEELEN